MFSTSNDHQHLNFVKDIYVVGKKRPEMIAKVPNAKVVLFISNQSLSMYIILDISINVWCIKNQTKHSRKTSLSLVRFLMHQTLVFSISPIQRIGHKVFIIRPSSSSLGFEKKMQCTVALCSILPNIGAILDMYHNLFWNYLTFNKN